ncbi:unnamed protein product, partial [Rotaria sp. Silwood1]
MSAMDTAGHFVLGSPLEHSEDT